MFTIETQIQLGMSPQWHPYLFLILFATLCEYNVHRFITVITNKAALNSEKHKWVKDNLVAFYALVVLSVVGFVIAAFMAKKEVLMTLAPIAALTLLYSIPVYGNKKSIFRLREIPYLKIFIISFTWSATTVLLPLIQTGQAFDTQHVSLILIERFVFVLAITIPFDIRDMEADRAANTKTIPLLLGEKRSMIISYSCILIFLAISLFHYNILNQGFIAMAMVISALSTFVFLKWDTAKRYSLYHYAVLDGTIILQGLLVIGFVFCF
ncbi:MAG: UbiA family prenyltransferase [Sphingobacteriaceae bacterium]|nr:UbiA family prenyltransferase [Sphingobacteriaceae bacterium]